ncbi:MAG: ATP synthase F0 subunit C [Deltaproteobacteria bacterium]|nr:ATP synthase F0 subunit C [Deltaproteobacteria bacterium]
MNRNIKILLVAVATFLFASMAFAAEGGPSDPYASLAAGLGIAIAAFGGSLGQGKAASAALEGIARNPAAAGKLFVPMIIGLALIESLVIYAFLVTFVKIQLH